MIVLQRVVKTQEIGEIEVGGVGAILAGNGIHEGAGDTVEPARLVPAPGTDQRRQQYQALPGRLFAASQRIGSHDRGAGALSDRQPRPRGERQIRYLPFDVVEALHVIGKVIDGRAGAAGEPVSGQIPHHDLPVLCQQALEQMAIKTEMIEVTVNHEDRSARRGRGPYLGPQFEGSASLSLGLQKTGMEPDIVIGLQ